MVYADPDRYFTQSQQCRLTGRLIVLCLTNIGTQEPMCTSLLCDLIVNCIPEAYIACYYELNLQTVQI